MKKSHKLAAFAAGFIIILLLLDIIFDAGYWYEKGYVAHRDARLAGIEVEAPGQIDVICVGNSLGICGVAPMELYKDYGITSYNIGCEMQMPVETYYTLKQALKKQPVKVVLWEANNLSKHHKKKDIYGSRLAEDIRYRFPFTRYHYVWKNMIDGFIPRTYFKGFVVNDVVKPYTKGDYYDYNDKHEDVFSREQYYYFDKIKKMCDKKGIKIVLYGVPSPVSYNIRMHRGIDRLAQENGVEFLDGNAEPDKVGIDWNTDTFDGGDHLNLSGSRKLTHYLAQHLVKDYGLKDHRGDPAYREWDDLWVKYEQEVEKMKGTSYPVLEKSREKGRHRPKKGKRKHGEEER